MCSLLVLENRSLNAGISRAGLPLRLWEGPSLLLSDVRWLPAVLGTPAPAPGPPLSPPPSSHGLLLPHCRLCVLTSHSPPYPGLISPAVTLFPHKVSFTGTRG